MALSCSSTGSMLFIEENPVKENNAKLRAGS
jgi:hypothetical protein